MRKIYAAFQNVCGDYPSSAITRLNVTVFRYMMHDVFHGTYYRLLVLGLLSIYLSLYPNIYFVISILLGILARYLRR